MKFGYTYIIIFSLCFCTMCKNIESSNHAALFDNFQYDGNDAFYNENPLPTDESFYNPILQGWHSDPTICTNGEGDYFIATSTYVYFPSVALFHSKDLVNWTQIGHILNRPTQLEKIDEQATDGGIFAPALSYNHNNKTYYMATTNVGVGMFFVKTTDPFGEWSDPIMLQGIEGYDPSFFFDDDGKAYLINNDEAPNNQPEYSGHRTIRIQEFDIATDKIVGEQKILINKGARPEEKPIWIESPHMYKIKGRYYLMDAEGGTCDWHSEVIFSSASPWGPFLPYKNNPILTQRHLDSKRQNPITCAGHADLVEDENGDWWSIFLACRPFDELSENLGRETFIAPVRWNNGKYPIILEGDDLVPMILEKKGVQINSNSRNGNFSMSDKFESDTLGIDWITLRSDAKDLYSLTEIKGALLLKCSERRATQLGTPAMIVRRICHQNFECSTDVTFTPENTEEAGMILFKDERHHYFMSIACVGGERVIRLHKIGNNTDEILAEQNIKDGLVKMKISSDGPNFNFEYAISNEEWTILASNIDARYLSTAIAGGFSGTTIGYYAIK